MRKVIIFLPLLLIACFVGFLVWANISSRKSAAPTLPYTQKELSAGKESVQQTIDKEASRKVLLGDAMYNYIVSQKKGLMDALPDQFKTYSYEDEEATDSRTIVVSYRFRHHVDPKSLSADKIASFQRAYLKENQSILNAMKAAGIQQPQIKSVYYNTDGSYLYTLHGEG